MDDFTSLPLGTDGDNESKFDKDDNKLFVDVANVVLLLEEGIPSNDRGAAVVFVGRANRGATVDFVVNNDSDKLVI